MMDEPQAEWRKALENRGGTDCAYRYGMNAQTTKRVVKNRARIGMAWRGQEGRWVETYNLMTGREGRRFDVTREQFFPTKAQAEAWCNE